MRSQQRQRHGPRQQGKPRRSDEFWNERWVNDTAFEHGMILVSIRRQKCGGGIPSPTPSSVYILILTIQSFPARRSTLCALRSTHNPTQTPATIPIHPELPNPRRRGPATLTYTATAPPPLSLHTRRISSASDWASYIGTSPRLEGTRQPTGWRALPLST